MSLPADSACLIKSLKHVSRKNREDCRGNDLLDELLFFGAASVNWWGGWLLASELHGSNAGAQGTKGDEGDLIQHISMYRPMAMVMRTYVMRLEDTAKDNVVRTHF